MVTLSDIKSARRRISGAANKTPVMTSRTLDSMLGCSVFLKCENFQRAGAFKFRGAYNAVALLPPAERAMGVITHSSGNHGQALALAAGIFGVKCVVVMPVNSAKVKVDAVRGYGAKVVRCGLKQNDRKDTVRRLIESEGYRLIHPYDDDNIIAGAGTCMLEFSRQVKNIDIVFCPVGGGGLISGTSVVAKGLVPKIGVVGVEPKNADDAYRGFKSGKIEKNTTVNTIADGLRTCLSERTFGIIRENVDRIITVSEEEIIGAMRLLWERTKLVVEPSGAVALAGLLSEKARGAKGLRGKRIGVILSGGNVDLDAYFGLMLQAIS